MRYATFMLFAAVAGLAIAEDIALDDNAITTMVKGKRLGATGPSAASFRLTFKDDGTLAGNEVKFFFPAQDDKIYLTFN